MSDGLSFAPLIPWAYLAVLGVPAAVLLAIAAVRGGRGVALRAATLAVLVLALINPRAVRENREPQPDVAVVVVDQSDSQAVGARAAQRSAALDAVRSVPSSIQLLMTSTTRGATIHVVAQRRCERTCKACAGAATKATRKPPATTLDGLAIK